RFHRYAHHPLCGRYAGELIRIGKLRLCRGCTLAMAGALVGGVVGAVVGGSPVLGLVALIVATAALVPTGISKRRMPKLASRFAPAGLFALAFATSALAGQLIIAAATLAIAVGLWLLYRRRGGDRTPCVSCPERELSPCSGFA